ncbi:MAG: cell division protein CrgA [Actinomycetota bacterium]|nr:cell division protein CrgA [Actinomycetota bacterium]
MSTPPKKRVEGGRVTPKGGPSGSRYNTPTSSASKASPTWVPVLMFGLLALGIVIIFFNYVGWMPGGTSNGILLLGLGSILGGIITATQYH